MGGLRPQKPQTLDLELFEPEVGGLLPQKMKLLSSVGRSIGRSIGRLFGKRQIDQLTERPNEQPSKRHTQSPEIDPIEKHQKIALYRAVVHTNLFKNQDQLLDFWNQDFRSPPRSCDGSGVRR